MGEQSKIDQILELVKSERGLNNDRFTQLSTGLMDLRKEVRSVDKKIDTVATDLKQEINRGYIVLSEDVQVFAEDLEKVKTRVAKIERKIA